MKTKKHGGGWAGLTQGQKAERSKRMIAARKRNAKNAIAVVQGNDARRATAEVIQLPDAVAHAGPSYDMLADLILAVWRRM